ncbi:Sas10/Utp3/C1D family-domain-containing protein [Hypoxylon sp. FL1150]|nr:Sas10/Utp3/C1D family-domain-containing protein [Hypoxylon sp. FL1150]
MDPANITPQLDRLDDELEALEEALQPILGNISDVASKLPLLDKAKLYVLATYSIESLLFSSLRLHGVDAKEHPVFKELTRVRQYFDKIKNAENPPQKPDQSLNKEAAIRFIRADLSENKDKQVNAKLTEMIGKERAKAAIRAAQTGDKRKAEESSPSGDPSAESGDGNADAAAEPSNKEKKSKEGKKQRLSKRKRNQHIA